MARLRETIVQFVDGSDGGTAIEYALLAAGIAVVVLAAILSLEEPINAMYEVLSAALLQNAPSD